MSPHIFGIRHHGPGSARSLRNALAELKPDIVLVEGPPEADVVLPLLVHAGMQPPVALLIYVPDSPRQAVYYPFAHFSPEWQAIHYALSNGVPVRFMDLPQAHQLSASSEEPPPAEAVPPEPVIDTPTATEPSEQEALQADPSRDPLGFLAAAAGYSDGERWWEHMVEQRHDSAGVFAAIQEAMSALRAAAPKPKASEEARREEHREAWMRQTIRAAEKEGFRQIAVVCGAWHGPALVDLTNAKGDTALLKGLPKAKVQATWIPWTYGRLAYTSGYGAGIESPGWYDHLFRSSDAGYSSTETAVRWLTHAARLLRSEGIDISSAHSIEAVRLAESLAALRDRPIPGLPELNEAARAVFCFDTDAPMRLIQQKLIIGERLGSVPEETPMVPLQQDLTREQKRLRMPAEADWRDLDLDLRNTKNALDLDRSRLLHRLNLLDVGWGKLQRSGGGKGTFHEHWRIQWQPELSVSLIEAGIWGNTILAAATNKATSTAAAATELPLLTSLVNQALLADLGDAIPAITARLENVAALTSDVTQMMAALPSLANIMRYGDVRKTDTAKVGHVVDGLVARVCIGLPGACASLNDDAAERIFKLLVETHAVVTLLQDPAHLASWRDVLQRLSEQHRIHGLIAGRSVRLLLDMQVFDATEVARRLGLALSTASDPAQAAAWIDGFLRDSGTLLVHDNTLWGVLDDWLSTLPGDVFTSILPLLRRTFATFQAPERRSLGERARRGGAAPHQAQSDEHPFDHERAAAVLPLVARLLGVGKNT